MQADRVAVPPIAVTLPEAVPNSDEKAREVIDKALDVSMNKHDAVTDEDAAGGHDPVNLNEKRAGTA